MGVPRMQYVDKPVPKYEMRSRDVVEEVPQILHEERPREVPQVVSVDLEHGRPRVEYQDRVKEIPKYVIEAHQREELVSVNVTHEKPVEYPQVQLHDVIKQEHTATWQFVDKPVPLVGNEVVARTVGKPLPLLEERVVEVPQVQVAEAIKEELVPNVQEVTKAIPKKVPNYIEKVIEINQGNVIHEEVPTREIDYGVVAPRAIEYASTPLSDKVLTFTFQGEKIGFDYDASGFVTAVKPSSSAELHGLKVGMRFSEITYSA